MGPDPWLSAGWRPPRRWNRTRATAALADRQDAREQYRPHIWHHRGPWMVPKSRVAYVIPVRRGPVTALTAPPAFVRPPLGAGIERWGPGPRVGKATTAAHSVPTEWRHVSVPSSAAGLLDLHQPHQRLKTRQQLLLVRATRKPSDELAGRARRDQLNEPVEICTDVLPNGQTGPRGNRRGTGIGRVRWEFRRFRPAPARHPRPGTRSLLSDNWSVHRRYSGNRCDARWGLTPASSQFTVRLILQTCAGCRSGAGGSLR